MLISNAGILLHNFVLSLIDCGALEIEESDPRTSGWQVRGFNKFTERTSESQQQPNRITQVDTIKIYLRL